MEVLSPRLPDRYSPLLPDGKGSQSVYLAEIPAPLFEALRELIGYEAKAAWGVAEND